MKHISVNAFKEVLEAEKNNKSIDFVNVCEPAEYNEKHIEGVRNVPLGEIQNHIDEFKDKQTVYIHCRSGNRGQKAIEKLSALGLNSELVNVEGGIMAWDEAGHPTMSLTNRLPIIRQVMLVAGILILIGFFGSAFLTENFMWLILLVGLGLTASGVTGWCGMAILLSKMPWNK